MMDSLSNADRLTLTGAVVHLINRDFAGLAQDFVDLGFLNPKTELTPIIPALEEVLGGALGDNVGSFNFKAITDRFSELMYAYPFRVPARFALIIRAVVSQEGLAMRLNPAIPAGTADMLGRAYMFDGQAAPAITAFENLLKRDLTPNEIFPIRSWLAVLYLERGDDTKAREQQKLALEAKPDLTATYFRRTYIYKDAAKTVLRWTGALRKLGLPEQ